MSRVPVITCIGELIVDMISASTGSRLEGAETFYKRAGGAAANVAVGCARLGVSSRFIGRVGNDSFGKFLKKELQRAGVDASGVKMDAGRLTRLAFVSRTASGGRDFEFHEQSPADEAFGAGDVNIAAVAGSRIVHVSSFLLLNERTRAEAFAVTRKLRKRGVLISFDPNLRLSLWESRSRAKKVLTDFARLSDILRLNDSEAAFMTGKPFSDKTVGRLHAMGPGFVAVTRGSRGCLLSSRAGKAACPGFSVRAVDTTGCGDAFLAGLLTGIARATGTAEMLLADELKKIGTFANAAGALTAEKVGVIPALPSRAAVQRLVLKGIR